MKLEDQLHLLEPVSLARFFSSCGGFPSDCQSMSAHEVAVSLLNRELYEAEWSTGNMETACVFWSSGKLRLIRRQTFDTFVPHVVVVSALRGSSFSANAVRLGLLRSIHPFAYTPEWVECFVFGARGEV
jgi:hypothetical protein